MTKLDNLIVSMNKAAERITKLDKTIERHFTKLEKLVAGLRSKGYEISYEQINFHSLYAPFMKELEPIEKLKWRSDGKVNPDYADICDVCTKLEDIRSAKRKQTEAKQVLTNWEKKVLAEQNKTDFINSQVPQVIIEFVDAWKQLAFEWHMKNDKYPNAETLETFLENEKQIKILDLTSRVNEVVGTITDARHLDVSNSGNLNGFIIGEKGKAHVETITAGGYNIQCFHYRTLVSKA